MTSASARVSRAAAALGLAAALAALAGCGAGASGDSPDGDGPLVVSAAASLRQALTECGRSFPDAEVRLSFGGSDELAAQIRQGVKPGVYAAANTRIPGELAAEGLVDEPVEFATNELVIAVPAGSRIRSLADLAEPGVAIAVGSESVPVGSYTRAVLDRLPDGEREAIEANVRTREPDVKGVIGKLTQGAVDAAFVYRTDVKATGGEVVAIALPPDLEPSVAYGAAAVKDSGNPAAARAYLDDLTGGACAGALRDAGFGPPGGGS